MSDVFENVSPRVVELVCELNDRSLTNPERVELSDLLAADAASLQWYLDWMSLHSMLHLDLAGDLALPTPRLARVHVPMDEVAEDSDSSPPHRNRWPIVAAAASLAAAIGLVSLGMSLHRSIEATLHEQRTAVKREAGAGGEAVRQQFREFEGRAIAIVSRVADASWSSSVRLGQGARLMPGRFVLESGAVQLEFLSGANLVVEAPADIELISTMSVYCRRGKVRARIPQQAHGFTIETPTHRAIDLGTEFAVDVGEEDDTEVHVMDGEVKLQGKLAAAGDAQRLVFGDAYRGGPGGDGATMPADEDRFMDSERLIQLSERDAEARYAKWREYSRGLADRPNVVTYFNFEDHARSGRTLRQDGPLHGGAYDGAIVGCRWAEGRWPMKQSLEFKGVDDRVRLNIPGEFDSISLACWVRIDGFDRFLSSLLLPEGHDVGEVHWQFTDTGKLLLGVKADSKWSQDYFSGIVLQPVDIGRWIHLACVYDRELEQVVHFVDGQRVSHEPIRKHVALRFGQSEIGNWVPEIYRDHRIRALNGRLDEFILFKKAMSDEEIKVMYESGKPNS